jgi:glycerol kinase
MGAACLAGLGIGCWSGVGEIAGAWKKDKSFKSGMTGAERKELIGNWLSSVEKA